MKKLFLSAILISQSAILMSQNIVQTNILVAQTNVRSTSNRGWLSNEVESNKQLTRTGSINRGRAASTNTFNSNTKLQRNIPAITPNRTNSTPTVSRTNVQTPIVQDNVTNDDNQVLNLNNPVQTNVDINVSNDQEMVNIIQVQSKEIQFLSNLENENTSLILPSLNLKLENDSKEENQSDSWREPKIKVGNGNEIKTEKVKMDKIVSNDSKTEKVKAVKTTIEKNKHHSSYRQQNKKYIGKKIKIWCKKNLKIAKKIRFSVSCPNF